MVFCYSSLLQRYRLNRGADFATGNQFSRARLLVLWILLESQKEIL